MKILYESTIEKIETRADHTVKVVIGTNRELSTAEMAALFSFSNKAAWTLHSSDDDLTEADVPPEKVDTATGQKSKATRLRAVIYRIWEQDGKKGNSEDHYQRVMERIIDQMKEKLN